MRLPLGALLASALLAPACSPETAPPADEHKQEVLENRTEAAFPGPAPVPAASAPTAASTPSEARRCGWLSNPTPANWWLTDRDGQWILSTQGADAAPGMDEMPDMSTAGWVETNGHYGYGCACMTITADADGQVTRVADAVPKPLKQCRSDRKLPKPG